MKRQEIVMMEPQRVQETIETLERFAQRKIPMIEGYSFAGDYINERHVVEVASDALQLIRELQKRNSELSEKLAR
jgi:DNA polymerase III delta prime subunit